MHSISRRDFLVSVGGATALPLTVQAQEQTKLPVVGFLHPGSPAVGTALGSKPFLEGLQDAGFVEGRNVHVETVWVDGHYDHLPAMVANLLRQRVAAIFAIGIATLSAVKAQTTSVPVVFSMGEDPVKGGFVASLARPGGNITGFVNFMNLLGSKRLTLLRGSVPMAKTFGILVNPDNPNADPDAKDWQAAATALGCEMRVFKASAEQDLEQVFDSIAQARVDAVFVNTDPLFIAWREKIVTLAAHHAVPTMYDRADFPLVGGLMSYGANETDTIRSSGIYVGRILRGQKPADLPVQLSTRFVFVINLRTARALGLDIPPTMSALADEVIE